MFRGEEILDPGSLSLELDIALLNCLQAFIIKERFSIVVLILYILNTAYYYSFHSFIAYFDLFISSMINNLSIGFHFLLNYVSIANTNSYVTNFINSFDSYHSVIPFFKIF